MGVGGGELGSATPHRLPALADMSGRGERLTSTNLPSVRCDMTLSPLAAPSLMCRSFTVGEPRAMGRIFHFLLCRTSYRVAAQRGPNLLFSGVLPPFDLSHTDTMHALRNTHTSMRTCRHKHTFVHMHHTLTHSIMYLITPPQQKCIVSLQRGH